MAEQVAKPGAAAIHTAEQRVSVASQWQLMWWRFRKHHLAVFSGIIIVIFYAAALGAEFFATASPLEADEALALMPPQTVRWLDRGQFRPHVYALTGTRDPNTLRRVYKADPAQKIPVRLFVRGFEYKFLGLIRTDRHLLGTAHPDGRSALFPLGTDKLGRDQWSRLMMATRISLSIGLVGVALSLSLGVLIGGVSGYYGGWTDTILQRLIEILRAKPTIPLWMGLAAALPRDWSILKVYFAITIIISLIGWTELGRVVRGRFLSLREEDFVMAAELAGASRMRIIFRHMVPSFTSHIIAATTLTIPAMIVSETVLSFLGLGLRPPAISWGVLLQAAQNVQAVAVYPWLMIPAVSVIVAVLAFNFLGDGLRDAADPYGQ